MSQSVQILDSIRTNIKQGREKAFFGQYQEAVEIFKPQMEKIQNHLHMISDQDLQKQWQKLQTEIQCELDVVQNLLQVVNKGQQFIPQQQQQQPQQQNNNNNYGNNRPLNNNNHNNIQNQPQQQQQQQPPKEKKVFPFNQVPFAHHHFPQDAIQVPPMQQQQSQQQQQQQFEDPWNHNNAKRNSNKQQVNQQYAPPGNMQPNIFGQNQSQPDFDNNWLRPNLNKNQDKDPDVWDPPAPIARQKKKPSNFDNNNNNNNNKNYLDKIRGGAGGKQGEEEGRRDYKKPWQVNAKTPKVDKKKVGGGRNNVGDNQSGLQQDERESYLYSVYPDGRGPDSELINMLEREIVDKAPNIKFEDIAELETAKDILQEAVLLPLLMPNFFTGIKRPWKGVLLFGPPGTGKTMLAKAVATTGKTTFFNVSASSLASKWRGEAEKLVRILFEMARFYAPTTIFFDEVDSLGSKRVEGENEASRRVKSELLVQMDGCGGSQGSEDQEKKTVMVLAATNHPWDLDEALRRRLEKRILIPLPTEVGRQELFKLNLRNVNVEENIDWDKLVSATEGFSGADIANICREAALFPMRRLLKKQGGFKNIADMEKLQKDAEVPLTWNDFEESLKNCSKSVSNTDLKKFEDWMAEFGSV